MRKTKKIPSPVILLIISILIGNIVKNIYEDKIPHLTINQVINEIYK